MMLLLSFHEPFFIELHLTTSGEELHQSGFLSNHKLQPLVTHRFPLEKAYEGFDITRRGEAVKVMIKCLPDD